MEQGFMVLVPLVTLLEENPRHTHIKNILLTNKVLVLYKSI